MNKRLVLSWVELNALLGKLRALGNNYMDMIKLYKALLVLHFNLVYIKLNHSSIRLKKFLSKDKSHKGETQIVH